VPVLAEGGAEATVQGQVLGTPAYMAPEQAEGRLDRLGPATDVYGLGAILYEVLCGRPPFAGSETTAVLRQVIHEEPARPRELAAGAPRALEAVCLKALAKEAGRRYGSAREVADEVQHWLAGEPVAAYREPWPARLARWARRHRTLVSSAAALLVTAVVGLGLGLAALEQERRRTANERDHKEEALRAETRARTLAMNALRKLTDDVVEQQLARRAQLTDEDRRFLRDIQRQYEEFAALPGEDAEQRAIRAEGHYRVGLVRARLGEGQEAEAAYREALGLYQHLAAEFPSRPKFRHDLAGCHGNLGNLLKDTGRPQEAAAAYADALAIQKQLAAEFPAVPNYRQELARTQGNLGIVLSSTGRPQQAEAAYRAALDIQKALAGDFPAVPSYSHLLAVTHTNQGILLRDTARPQEAEAAYRAALDILKPLVAVFPHVPEYHSDVGNTLDELAELARRRKDYHSARRLLEEAQPYLKKALDANPRHPFYREVFSDTRRVLGATLLVSFRQACMNHPG
jgi:serine/threonine-protein kinase